MVDISWEGNKKALKTVVLRSAMKPKYIIIFIGVFIGIVVLGLVYLKNYRIEYCETKYRIESLRRIKCLDEPLLNFVFK